MFTSALVSVKEIVYVPVYVEGDSVGVERILSDFSIVVCLCPAEMVERIYCPFQHCFATNAGVMNKVFDGPVLGA